MSERAARLIRKFCAWAGVKSQAELRQRKRSWRSMNHRQRGQARRKMEAILLREAKGPRKLDRRHA